MASSELTLPVDFLEAVAQKTPAPGGGSVSAVTAAMAAALVEMAARFSHDWPEAAATVEQARTLRERLVELARADAEAYAAFLAVEPDAKAAALQRATDVPLEIMEAATEVALLAAEVHRAGNDNLEGDAFTAARLAEAATKAAEMLVRINRQSAQNLESEPQ